MAITLGINGLYTHDSSAVLLLNGKVVAGVEEERFTNIKHTSDMPRNSIDFCLHLAGVAKDQVETIAVPFDLERRLNRSLSYTSGIVGVRLDASRRLGMSMSESFSGLLGALDVEKRFIESANEFAKLVMNEFPRARLQFYEHHLAHAASAYFMSDFKSDCVVVVADLIGEWDSITVYAGEKGVLRKIFSIQYPISFGKIYNLFTCYLGFRAHSDEYKVMGLGAYGEDKYNDFFDEIFVGEAPHLRAGPSFDLLNYGLGLKPGWWPELEALLGKPRSKGHEIERHHKDIACSLQAWLERMMSAVILQAVSATGYENLCLSGGVCLNAVMNQKIRALANINRIFVQPASHDAGTALGSSILAHLDREPTTKIEPLKSYYLGPASSLAKGPARGVSSKMQKGQPKPTEIAKMLHDGLIVGVCIGRAEFGPRALGNRSILADARDPLTKDRLNLFIKKREDFRPFAPVILEEHASKYFKDCDESPYMTMTFSATETAMENIPGAIHIDGSARVQTVNKRQNPFLFELLCAYHKLSGIPALLNTSLNIAGDAMALSEQDAKGVFERGNLDALVVEDGVFVR